VEEIGDVKVVIADAGVQRSRTVTFAGHALSSHATPCSKCKSGLLMTFAAARSPKRLGTSAGGSTVNRPAGTVYLPPLVVVTGWC
jgi:hypothetical protein